MAQPIIEMRRRVLLAGLAGCVAAPAAAAAKPSPAASAERRRERRHLFGTPCELVVAASTPVSLTSQSWALLHRIHTRWNAWKPAGLRDMNDALARGHWTSIDPLLARVVRRAARLEQQSLGCFNPAIGRWVAAWGFHQDRLEDGRGPAASQVARWRALPPSLASLEFDTQGEPALQVDAESAARLGAEPAPPGGGEFVRVRAHDPRLRIDLGAYAKGVAIDLVLDQLAREGVGEALLNLGGNLGTLAHGSGPGWTIGVRDPFGGGLVARVGTRGREAVVTSGIYERARMVDGQRRGHVLDPRRAEPVQRLASVTVIHRDAGLADAASTALLVAGPHAWRDVAARMGVDEVLVVDAHGALSGSGSFAGHALALPA